MKINKLNNEFFYDFISGKLGIDVSLYKDYLQILRTDKHIKIQLFLGGEIDDVRKFLFNDQKCVFKKGGHNEKSLDFSYDWVKYVINYADELSDDDKQEIVDTYNNNIENEIKEYTTQKRGCLI